MSVSWHWRHSGPHVVKWVVGLHHVGRLEAVPPSDHIQLVVYHRHAELQPPPVHDSHLDPIVGAQVVLLDRGGTWSHRSRKNIWGVQTQAGGQLLLLTSHLWWRPFLLRRTARPLWTFWVWSSGSGTWGASRAEGGTSWPPSAASGIPGHRRTSCCFPDQQGAENSGTTSWENTD